MMRPIIGITCSTAMSSLVPQAGDGILRTQDVGFRTYVRAVAESGGVPVFLPLVREPEVLEHFVETLDGLLLTGGPDVNPLYFQQEPHPQLGVLDQAKDLFELELTKLAFARDLPILGICRGIQVLNVAGGGNLYQDIPSEITTSGLLKHRQQAPLNTLTHSVNIKTGTLLHEIVGETSLSVNSHHHQAVRDIAPDFRITARAGDGVIECLDCPKKHFVLGVQWHPEGSFQEDIAARRIFQAFIAAGRE